MSQSFPSFQLYGEQLSESAIFWIHCETLPARSKLHNWEIAPHRHDAFFQIFMVTAGQGLLLDETKRIALVAPCFIFIPQYAVHGFSFSPDVDGLVMTALGDRLDTLASSDHRIAEFARQTRLLSFKPDSDRDDTSFAARCLGRIFHELTHWRTSCTLMLEHLVPTVLVSLARASVEHLGDRGSLNMREGKRLESLEALIGAHYRQRRDIDFYAKRVGVSRTHLNRIARGATGHSVHDLIVARLIEAAKRDLIFSPSPVQTIAYSLGFADPAYFNRFFRRRMGVSPGVFRDKERSRLADRHGSFLT